MLKRLFCAVLCLAALMSFAAQASEVTLLSSDREPNFPASAKLLKCYFLNVHAASDAIILVYDDKTMVIDCGDTRYGTMYVKPMLDELGITYVDYAYNTHPHDDHINGFISLFDEIKVGTFYTGFPLSYCEEQTNVIRAAMQHGVNVVSVDNESDISFGDLEIWLYQDPNCITSIAAAANDSSMIMHIKYGDSTMMITGDAGKTVYTDMYELKGDEIRSDIFKMPHHGYNMPTYAVFKILAPKYAVITNSYSEKISASNEFLRNNACPVLYTGRGIVEVVTDGTRWTIRQLTK